MLMSHHAKRLMARRRACREACHVASPAAPHATPSIARPSRNISMSRPILASYEDIEPCRQALQSTRRRVVVSGTIGRIDINTLNTISRSERRGIKALFIYRQSA